MRLVVLGLVSLAVLAVAACGDTAGPKTTQSPSSQADRIDMVASDDAEMNAAITTAKQSFGRFLDAFLDPQPGQSAFEVKAVFVEGDNAEHLWLADLDLSDAHHLKGTVANKPALLSLRFKQRVEFEPSQITDWMYVQDGKLVGGYTTRVLRDRMSPQKRAAFDAASPYRF